MNTNNGSSLESAKERIENDEIDDGLIVGNDEKNGTGRAKNGTEAVEPKSKKARLEAVSPGRVDTLSSAGNDFPHKLPPPPPPPPTPASPYNSRQHLHGSVSAAMTQEQQQQQQSMTFTSLDVHEEQDNLSALSSANSSPCFSGDNPDISTSENKNPASNGSSVASSISSSPSFTVPPVPPSTPVSDHSYTASGSASALLAAAASTSHSSLHVPSLHSNNSDRMSGAVGMGKMVGQQAFFQSMATPVPRRQEEPQPETYYATTTSNSATMASSTLTSNEFSVQEEVAKNGSEFRRRGVKRGTPKYSSTSSTSAHTKPSTQDDSSNDENAPDDFKDWKVGSKYELMRILGRGSYGEVAQARMAHAKTDSDKKNSTNFVAIKRISKAFELEVDALRLFREIYILRKLKGHECIIQLVDIIPPESCSINDFNDLYLVFDCKFNKFLYLFFHTPKTPHSTLNFNFE